MRWLNGITALMDMSLSKLWEIVKNRKPGMLQSMGMQRVVHDLTTKKQLEVLHAAKLLQSCLTVCDPTDYSPPGSSVHGIPQTRMLDWVESESESEVTQLCPTLCDPMDCSPPCSSVHGISQARILDQVAISFTRR